jgi:ATP-dependent exoDNAse (exonuclease V) alpha subunit
VHSHVKIIKRSDGRDVVAKCAYNNRSNLTNINTNKTHYHKNKKGLVYEAILLPKDSPNWLEEIVQDRAAFWSAVDKRDIRKDAQLAREVDVALLSELNTQQNIDLLVSCVQRQFVDRGMVADIAIHEPPKGGDPRNVHAHILLTMREITPNGFGLKVRAWNHRSLIREWREAWANEANLFLERNGFKPRLDHRSFKERNIDKEPTRYQGPLYNKSKQQSKGHAVQKDPIDVWTLLRETIEKESNGRASKGIELEK